MREAHYQQLLTWRVGNLFVGSGLSQPDYSIGGGRLSTFARGLGGHRPYGGAGQPHAAGPDAR
jgi:hypothetical protein